jgi:hypothetical protein
MNHKIIFAMLAIVLVALFYLFEVSLQPDTKLLPEGGSPELNPAKEPIN